MDEAHDILLSSLKSSGVSIPVGVSSIKDLSSVALLSICAQSLRLILDSGLPTFPTSLPAATAERFKICAELAMAIKSLGYEEELGFHQFLYSSDEESYKLVRFLVERLSKESSEGKKVGTTWPEKLYPENSSTFTSFCRGQSIRNSSESENLGSNGENKSFLEGTSQDLSDGYKSFIYKSERKWPLQQEHVSKLEDEIKDLNRQEKKLMDEVHPEALYVQKHQDVHDILKVPLDVAVNRQQSIELYIQELDSEVKSRQQGVMELETKRNVTEHSLKEERMNFEQTFYPQQPEVQERLIRLKEIEQEIEATLAEISKREAEHLDLLLELKEQPKLPSRKSFIERITEITKNSRKLDADIKQILKVTRELQLESNSIQERLHRTHAVVDETIFREAKKDQVGRQAYRLLTSIHDNFQQMAETILATDRAQREAAGLEAKLAKISSRGFVISKLQADVDSIRKENELLQQKCHNSLS